MVPGVAAVPSRRAFSALACVVLVFALSSPVRAEESNTASLVARLRAADWWTVRCAKEELESLWEKAIPAPLDLVESRDLVPLTNTMDLIYPGAKTFYGHGEIVNYALDSLAVRAGWVLESITFQDFGFGASTITEDELFKVMREHEPGDMPLEQAAGPQRQPERELIAAAASLDPECPPAAPKDFRQPE